VSPLPGKSLFSALYGICFIKICSVLYNLRVPFAGCEEKNWWEEGTEDGEQGKVKSEGKFWPL
jgi:hypothetical protein